MTLSENKEVTKSMHRLVMFLFVRYSVLEVNYIDSNKRTINLVILSTVLLEITGLSNMSVIRILK